MNNNIVSSPLHTCHFPPLETHWFRFFVLHSIHIQFPFSCPSILTLHVLFSPFYCVSLWFPYVSILYYLADENDRYERQRHDAWPNDSVMTLKGDVIKTPRPFESWQSTSPYSRNKFSILSFMYLCRRLCLNVHWGTLRQRSTRKQYFVMAFSVRINKNVVS